MNWIEFTVLILNTIVTILTNKDVNRKRSQDRSID